MTIKSFISNKKYRYLIQSMLVSGFLYYFSSDDVSMRLGSFILVTGIILLVGTFLVHFPNNNIEYFLPSISLPTSVLYGGALSLYYYPNFGELFRLCIVVGFGFMHYVVSLVDNVFLVVEERESSIPLYRAASAWSHILQVLIAVPLFSGIYKIPLTSLTQSLILGVIAFVFVYYQFWVYRLDPDARKTRVGEMVFLMLASAFIVTAASLCMSFLPAESFIRSLALSSVLMFVLNYVSSHLKNEITKKLLIQYALIILFFVVLLVFLTP